MSKKELALAAKAKQELTKIEEDLLPRCGKLLNTDKYNFAKRAIYLLQEILTESTQEASDEALLSVIEMISQFEPKNGTESIIVIQMCATYEASMKCMKRATEAKHPELYSAMLKNADKMMRMFLDQLRMLHKLRGGGDQKMVIEHVNVAPGAQAIVGTVHAPVQALPKPSQRAIAQQPQASLPAPKKGKSAENATRKK